MNTHRIHHPTARSVARSSYATSDGRPIARSGRRAAERGARSGPAPRVVSTLGRVVTTVLRAAVVAGLAGAAVLLMPGFLLDTPQAPPRPSDAIVVISGDEQMARFQEGLALYQRGYGKFLVFSGAAYDNGTSNADVMRDMAIQRGVPNAAILDEPQGGDTWGNAVFTRRVLEDHHLHSAILVTSPYHARRAKLTFDAAYAGSEIALVVHAAPDSEWRKLSWWRAAETRRLTVTELQKLVYIGVTGQYH